MNRIDEGNGGGAAWLRESRRFLRFLAAGGLAAVANFGSRIVLSQWLAFAPAVILAYLVGLATAFALFRGFIFTRPHRPLRQQLFWFVVVNLVAMLQTVLISLLLADVILPHLHVVWHAREIAHAGGIVAPVFTSYFGHKWLSFSTLQGNNGHDRGISGADSSVSAADRHQPP
ncbi:MAG: GtrA family protein [Proteobacteria bacterium]|uniref:GtrA family protein n=1 Tax=Rudaea sp. TaxID=2136325 RepID=UPI00322088BF|nr:GtrA family protein [Pseudomonadota bacterium]